MEKKFKIFMDFDGTVTEIDVGEAIFREFGDKDKSDEIVDDLLNDRISSKECWIKLCHSIPKIDKKKLDEFINKMYVDPTFNNLIDYCNERKTELYILSDGFDYYVDKILEKNNIKGIKTFSNHLEVRDRLIPDFPYYDEACFSSSNCKRNHIINNSSDDDFTVFIGDGNSDKDAVEYCDFVFAKNDLLRYCEIERITFFPFKDFNDVIKKLGELEKKKRLKKTHRAQLKRQQAYINE